MARRKPQDPYAGLSLEFRAAIESADETEIRRHLSEAALETYRIVQDMENDPDYQRVKAELKVASEDYVARKKDVKLQIKFMKAVLDSRGRGD